ncbi:gag-pol polyprotein, partial [Cystoisospora suis]
MPAYESELRAIVHALTKWRQFIGSKKVIIETDHATLSRILKQRQVNPRLGYWLDKILDFNIEVIYKPGRQNVVADAISRRPDFLATVTRGNKEKERGRAELKGDWDQEYEACDDFKEVWQHGRASGKEVADQGESQKAILFRQREYQREANFLWVRTKAGWKVCVPGESLRKEILEHFHDHILAGHPGIDRTRLAVRSLFWWPRMDLDIEMFVKACVQCARGKASHLKSGGLLQPLPIPNLPWEEISMDLIVGLPTTEKGFDAILTVVCRLTKMAHFVPTTQAASAEDIARLIVKEVIRLHGVPKAIVSDRDTRFTGELWRSLCESLKIKQRTLTAYPPQTDGQSERTNQTIEQMLRCALSGNDKGWAKILPLLEFAYNSTQHSSSKQAPFEL